AKERGIDVDALLADLSRAIAERHGELQADPRELTTPRLVAHIVSKHHEYLRKALPFVKLLAVKVGRVHGDHNPKLRDLDGLVGELMESLLTHLDDEELTLFPALTAKDHDRAERTKLLDAMHSEHLIVAELLERIRAASDDFSLPDWACNSYRTLFAELRQIESDIFTHVHLENHVLKPRFAATAA
ncbi:MAG: hemerythrin domain-containing protein, partial [Polyangiaceae bacterium]|nr:hemerythrin domain-containing protein [Polyangiaceae bacterium]